MNSNDPCCPPAAEVELPTDEESTNALLAALCKALGHPARVAILRMLVRHEGCIVGEIVEELPLAQSTISQHLKQLKSAGLIRGEVDGPRICYCVDPNVVAQLKALVQTL